MKFQLTLIFIVDDGHSCKKNIMENIRDENSFGVLPQPREILHYCPECITNDDGCDEQMFQSILLFSLNPHFILNEH